MNVKNINAYCLLIPTTFYLLKKDHSNHLFWKNNRCHSNSEKGKRVPLQYHLKVKKKKNKKEGVQKKTCFAVNTRTCKRLFWRTKNRKKMERRFLLLRTFSSNTILQRLSLNIRISKPFLLFFFAFLLFPEISIFLL